MMHQNSPHRPSGHDRRRVERVRPGPLRVRLHRTCEGWLIDISELGALVRLPTAQTSGKHVTLHLEWGNQTVPLAARVIRCTPHVVQLAAAVLARPEYQVGLEFQDLSQDVVAGLRRIIEPERR